MKKVILTLFVLGFVSLNGYCQMVYKAANGSVYLDCTDNSKMPSGAVTTTPKCVSTTAYNNAYRNNTTATNPYATENDKVFSKLEIDKSDYDSGIAKDWATAYNACKSKNTGGVTGWRLPTQRELMLIYIFRDQLYNMSVGFSSSDSYWSSSESSSSNSWYINFGLSGGNGGGTYTASKTATYCVRCVREVTH